MAGAFGSTLGNKNAQHARKRTRIRSVFARGRHQPTRRLTVTGAVILSSATIAAAVLPLATSASAQGTWTVTLSTPTGATTTGFVANGSVTPDGNAGFAEIAYEPTGTAITSSSPTAGVEIYNAGVTTAQAVSVPVDQLTPNTSYTYELEATEDDNDAMFFSSPSTITTPPNPTGTGTPIDPPNDPPSIGIFGFCGSTTDQGCVNDMNGVRAAQEQLPPITLPSNWSALTGIEQMFVYANLERTSRGEAAIPNLVNTYDSAVQTGLTNDADPSLSGVPGGSGAIWAGAYPNVASAYYGWLYDDGPGGENGDCTAPGQPGCWGHRDNILSNASNFGSNPTEMDAGDGTDSSNAVDYDAIFDANPNPTPPANIVFTWAQELPFLVASTPVVTAVSPTSGPTGGGTTVTITGTGFTGATKVVFGAVAATSFTVVSDTEITAVSPAQAAALHNIYVTTPAGTSAAVAADQFTYVAGHPAVTAVSPTSGPTGGGTTVTITGTNLNGATKVLFGAVAATSFSVVSSTEITAVSPAQAAAVHGIYVTTPGGTSAAVPADQFTYVEGHPAITGISPTSGPTSGGTTVTITGTNLNGATKVLFGAVAATSFTVVSSTEITTVSPAEAAAVHGIYVTTPGGTSTPVPADQFTFVNEPPSVSGISPTSGPTTGGTTVTITGANFTGATKVVFGAVAATSFTVVSSTEITAVSPAQAAGFHNIYVTTPNGTSAPVTADQFTYVG